MDPPGDQEPPNQIRLELDEALRLLAVLEDASATLLEVNQLGAVLEIEAEVRLLTHRLGFDDEGGPDGS